MLDALQASRWPDACDATLRAHVAGCVPCAELIALVKPLLEEHRALVQEAPVPSSAIVWWRAQMRSHREAAERAAQPISLVQGIAAACAVGLLATALGIFVPTFRKSFAWLANAAGAAQGLSVPVLAEVLANPVVLAVVAALGFCLVVAPIALYFTLHED